MMKKSLLIFLILLVPLVSAEILISQTNSLYNLGDDFDVTISVLANSDTSSFFTTQLACVSTNETKLLEIYKSPLSLKSGEEKTITISASFDKFLVGTLEGDCHLQSNFGEESASSIEFTLSRGVEVSMNTDKSVYEPGEPIIISGKAVKANGQPLLGFVEVTLSQVNLVLTGEVKDGAFNMTIIIPEDTHAGSYGVTARAYDKDSSGFTINEGTASSPLSVKQVPRSLVIELKAPSVMPETELEYSVFLLDQSGENIEKDIELNLLSPDGKFNQAKLTRTNTALFQSIPANLTPGQWKFQAKSDGFEAEKAFVVEEYRKLSFSLENNTLTVTNVGNILYEGPIEVTIGEVSEIKEMSLGVGQSKKFRLEAPNGEYQINVADGEELQNLGLASLTGKAISVNDVGFSIKEDFDWIIWILALLVLAVIAVIFIRRAIKKRKYGKPQTGKTGLKKLVGKVPAAGGIIDKGEKEESAVIALNLKNTSKLRKPELDLIDSVLWKVKETGAKIYSHENYRIIIFSKMLTRDTENNFKAIQAASNIERVLANHNRKSALKIEFGIGINSGSLIVEKKDSKFRFISVGNTVITAKNLSQKSNQEILISEEMHRKTSTRVKADKSGDKVWKVKRIVDRSPHAEYINRFVSKQRAEHKK